LFEPLVVAAMSGVSAGLMRAARKVAARRSDRESAPLVEDAHALEQLTRDVLNASVAAERSRGVSWATIGSALGITRSSAHGRFADVDGDPSAEAELQRAWQRIHTLAAKHVTPLTRSVADLDADVRDDAARRLRALILDPAADFETRLSAAELLPAVRSGDPARELESRLRKLPLAAGPVPHGDLQPENILPTPPSARVIDFGTSGAAATIVEQPDDSLLAKLVDTFRAARDAARHNGTPPERLIRLERELASLLLEKGRRNADPALVNEAVTVLHEVIDLGFGGARRDRDYATLGAALFVRYRLTGSRPDLRESVDLGRRAADRLRERLGDDHPAFLRALVEYGVRLGEVDDLRAEALLKDATRRMTEVLGHDDPETMEALRHFANQLAKAGPRGRRDAGMVLETLLSQQVRVLGSHDPRTRETQVAFLENLGERISGGDPSALEALSRMSIGEGDMPLE
jgi:hypothetical protein